MCCVLLSMPVVVVGSSCRWLLLCVVYCCVFVFVGRGPCFGLLVLRCLWFVVCWLLLFVVARCLFVVVCRGCFSSCFNVSVFGVIGCF